LLGRYQLGGPSAPAAWRARRSRAAPSVGGFVTVTGKATMEFDLRLQRT